MIGLWRPPDSICQLCQRKHNRWLSLNSFRQSSPHKLAKVIPVIALTGLSLGGNYESRAYQLGIARESLLHCYTEALKVPGLLFLTFQAFLPSDPSARVDGLNTARNFPTKRRSMSSLSPQKTGKCLRCGATGHDLASCRRPARDSRHKGSPPPLSRAKEESEVRQRSSLSQGPKLKRREALLQQEQMQCGLSAMRIYIMKEQE